LKKLSVKSSVVTTAATAAAAVLLGLSGARIVSYWLHANDEHKLETANNSQQATKPVSRKIDYKKLPRLHLFGQVKKDAKQDPAEKEVIKAPETRLNLKLIGVLFDRNNKDGYAIISESNKPQKAFRKGDKISGNTILYAVEPNRVILLRNGRHETLTLIKPDLHTRSPSSSNSGKAPAPTNKPNIKTRNSQNKTIFIDPTVTNPAAGPSI
jgi:general secretion pathway protein C